MKSWCTPHLPGRERALLGGQYAPPNFFNVTRAEVDEVVAPVRAAKPERRGLGIRHADGLADLVTGRCPSPVHPGGSHHPAFGPELPRDGQTKCEGYLLARTWSGYLPTRAKARDGGVGVLYASRTVTP